MADQHPSLVQSALAMAVMSHNTHRNPLTYARDLSEEAVTVAGTLKILRMRIL